MSNYKEWLIKTDLTGKSGKRYDFHAYNFDSDLSDNAKNVKGLYYIGKINDFPEVIDQYHLSITEDISSIKNEFINNENIKKDKEHYVYVIYEGNDKLSLEEILSDLDIDSFKKSL